MQVDQEESLGKAGRRGGRETTMLGKQGRDEHGSVIPGGWSWLPFANLNTLDPMCLVLALG